MSTATLPDVNLSVFLDAVIDRINLYGWWKPGVKPLIPGRRCGEDLAIAMGETARLLTDDYEAADRLVNVMAEELCYALELRPSSAYTYEPYVNTLVDWQDAFRSATQLIAALVWAKDVVAR
jgi:hypothetical protein